MKLFYFCTFLTISFFQINFGFAEPSEMTGVVLQHNKGNDQNVRKYRTIVDSSEVEQNVAKYQKLSDIFANPVPNQVVLLRGKLVQSLNGKDLFVFQDDNIISNMVVSPNLWQEVNEKNYVLDKNIQFLAKVSINQDNQSIYLQTIRIFGNYSKTENYVLTLEDKEANKALKSVDKITQLNPNNKLRLIADTSTSDETPTADEAPASTTEEPKPVASQDDKTATTTPDNQDLDSLDEEESNTQSDNPYIKSFKPKGKDVPASTKPITPSVAPAPEVDSKDTATKEEKAKPEVATPESQPAKDSSLPAEATKSEDSSPEKESTPVVPIIEEDSETEEEVEPEIEVKNKVPVEQTLQSRSSRYEDHNVLQPEELKRAEKNDSVSKPQSSQQKNSWYKW
ncbi:MAG: hypothetical protein LBH40_00605 [Alphaproteobacteria bacterium]|jgi:hypothetical protein|nr:hypothetical protein [Alphaproteobacteria bacterium]